MIPEDDHVVETLASDTFEEPLANRIQIRGLLRNVTPLLTCFRMALHPSIGLENSAPVTFLKKKRGKKRKRTSRASRRSVLLAIVLSLSCGGGPSRNGLASCPSIPDRSPADSAAMAQLPVGEPGRGAAVFERECWKCHAPRPVDRGSRLFRGYPRLDCRPYMARVSDAYLATVISSGGPAVGLDSAMKPFGGQLSPSEISDVIAYLRFAAQQEQ